LSNKYSPSSEKLSALSNVLKRMRNII